MQYERVAKSLEDVQHQLRFIVQTPKHQLVIARDHYSATNGLVGKECQSADS